MELVERLNSFNRTIRTPAVPVTHLFAKAVHAVGDAVSSALSANPERCRILPTGRFVEGAAIRGVAVPQTSLYQSGA